MNGHREGHGLPAWLSWLQVGLLSLLAVLFVTLLAHSREQSRSIQELKGRVQGLETMQSLNRDSVNQEQLREVVGRLDALERLAERLDAPRSGEAPSGPAP